MLLSIFFQFGHFEAGESSFCIDLLISIAGAAVGIGGAYWIYWLSITAIRKDRLKYVVTLIESIVPSAIRQSEFCKEYAELIVNQPYKNNNLKLEANRDPKRLSDKVDQEGVYHAYLWKYKRSDKTYKDFQILYGYIDYLDFVVDDLIKVNERILSSTWERKKGYQLAFKNASELIQSYNLIPELTQTQQELVNHLNGILTHYNGQQHEGENLVASYQNVVEPIKEYIVANATRHPKVTELIFILQDLTNQYRGIELQAKANAEDYTEYAKMLVEKANELRAASEQLRKDFSTKNQSND